MYILFTTFAVSLLGIIIMIGRKLSLVKAGHIVDLEQPHPLHPHLQKIKSSIWEKVRKYEHLALVLIIWAYVKSVNFLKQMYITAKSKLVKDKVQLEDGSTEEVEASGFLKMMSDYKYRIRHIKHKIKRDQKKR